MDESIPTSIIPSPTNLEVISSQVLQSLCVRSTFLLIQVIATLLKFLADFITSSEYVIIVGDFNLPDINWNSLTGISTFSTSFCDFIFDYNLVQFVYCPTHIKGNIVDIILSNTPFIQDICVEPSQLISSDHFIVSFGIEGIVKPVQKHKPELTFDFKNADMEGLFTYLLDYDFGYCFQINDIEQVWAVIKRAILKAMNLYIPKVKMKSRKYPRWFNADIIHLPSKFEKENKGAFY